MANDWRQGVVDGLSAKLKDGNVDTEEVAMEVLQSLANQEKDLPKKERVGYFYMVSNYKPRSLASFVKKVLKEANDGSEVPATPKVAEAMVVTEESNVSLIEEPLIPEEPAKESPKPTPKSNGSSRCVISLEVDKDYPEETIISEMTQHLKDKVGDSLKILEVGFVSGRWWDLRVEYSAKLVQSYEALFEHPKVIDAVTKQEADFGKETLAMVK